MSPRVDNGTVLKLTDFDDAILLPDGALTPSQLPANVGTTAFMAPEVVRLSDGSTSAVYDTRADIWSLGMLLFEVVTAQTPYADQDRFQLSGIIQSGQRPTWPSGISIDKRLHTIYRKGMVKKMPEDRWPIDQIIDHLDLFECATISPKAVH